MTINLNNSIHHTSVLITILYLSCWPPIVQAQIPQLHGRFENYTTQNGLSQNDIRTIFQDSDGYVWVGTHGGLNRFDGYSFKKFILRESNHYDISSNLISSMDEDSDGNLWIGTDDMGFMIYNKDQDAFESYNNVDSQLLTDNHIISILCDTKNTVWAVTSAGLNIVNRNNTGKVSIEQYTFPDNNVNCGYEDQNGNIWFGTTKGLVRYFGKNNSGNHQFINYREGNIQNIRDISSNDTSLIVSNNLGIFAIPFDSLEANTPISYTLSTYGRSTQHITDSKGNIWYTTNKGLRVIYKENDEIKEHRFRNNWSDKRSLSGDITTSIIEDNNGLIWIGTNGRGLNLYNPRKKNFEHYNRSIDPESITFNKIRAIHKDQNNTLWFGTEGGGVNYLKQTENGYDFRNGFKSISINPMWQDFVYTIEEAVFGDRRRLLIGSGFSTNFLELRDDGQRGFEVNPINPKPLGPVFCIIQDSKNNLWVGTYNKGLYYYKMSESGEIISQSRLNREMGMSSDIVRSIAEDQDGHIWIGTDSGINKLINGVDEGEKAKLVIYQQDMDDDQSLSYDYILPIYVAKDGNIWVGTLGGGLNRIIKGSRPDNDRFESISVENGLPSNIVKSLEEDAQGNLWLGTNHGLSRYNPQTKQIVNYGISDGLQDLEFGELASTKLPDGQMIFGGVNGFNTFLPEHISSDSSEIQVVLNSLSVLNKEVITGETLNNRVILDKHINRTENLILNHDENSFSVSFSGLNYVSPLNNKYAYILEGFEENWTYAQSSQRIAKYTNIPPGEYTLKIKASNADGYWNENPKSLKIEILPPLWSTPVARAIYIILLILALWFFRKYTIITNRKKNQLLIEHIEKEKVEEVSQLKLKFYTNVSHEFRTPLTLILGLLDRLKSAHRQLSVAEREKYFEKIYRNSQILLNLINQLLDFRKVEQGKMRLKVIEGDITAYIHLIFENFKELANKKSIEFSFICEDSIYGYYDQDVIERIMFNLLSNAFKFTPPEGEITVILEKIASDRIKIDIVDSGIGIPDEVRDRLFERFVHSDNSHESGTGIGLSYSKALVELYHGSIECISKKDVGTKFTVELPSTKDAFKSEEISMETEEIKQINKDVNWLIDTEKKEGSHNENTRLEHTILFVEDNEDILFYLEDHFKHAFNVRTAVNGKKALDMCLNEHIDMVVSDVMMPEMNGFELCEKLKEDERINHIPVVLLTARKSTDQKVKGYEKGADAYIGKPFDMKELETRMASLLNTRKNLLKKIRKNISLEPKEIEITSLDEKFLRRLMSYIEENIGMSEFTVEMLAHECGMSQLHLNKKLKVLVGQTANAFIRSMRLKRAGQLLAKDRYSVNEVMFEVGFIDAKYFRSCFKKEFGMTPSEYQKQHSLVD